MNLFDSHDVSRAHNNPEIDQDKWQGMVIMQFLWTGIPCIYYGDELEIDGYIEHDSGFRYKMPWEEEEMRKRGEHFRTYQKLNWLRSNEPAFSEGGRKVLFADGKIIVVARFMGDNIYIGTVSMEDTDRVITIPVGYVGAVEPENCDADIYRKDTSGYESGVDELGSSFTGRKIDDGMYELVVPAKASYVIKMSSP